MRAFASLLCVAAAAAAAAPPPCCAYGGDGSAVIYGTGVFEGDVTGIVFGTTHNGVAVLINSTDPDLAAYGWFVVQAADGSQSVHAYSPQGTGGKPTCASSPMTGVQLPGFALCPGAAQGLFPLFGASYNIGGSSLIANAYVQPPSGSRGAFLPAAQGCAPVGILSYGSPFGKAWSVDIEKGSAVAPPSNWFSMPSYCQ